MTLGAAGCGLRARRARASLVGAAFTALILAVSAQREATEREARSKDVTAASLQLEKLVSDVEIGLPRLHRHAPRELARALPQRAPASCRPACDAADRSSPTTPASGRARGRSSTRIRRVRERLRGQLIPLLREEPGPQPRTPALAQTGKAQTDEIRQLFREFRAAENDARRQAASRRPSARTDLAVLVGARRGHCVDGADHALRDRARTLGRPPRSGLRRPARTGSRAASSRCGCRRRGPGEVGELTRAFNSMAERLEQGREELEAQNEELRESERMKTELVNIVSHELRTPLASVLGFTALLLKRDFEPADPPPLPRHRRRAGAAPGGAAGGLPGRSANRARGRRPRRPSRSTSPTLLDEQAQLYAAQSPKHRLEVELAERPLTVRGDPGRLAQVVGNLLSNAIKYSPDGRHRRARRPRAAATACACRARRRAAGSRPTSRAASSRSSSAATRAPPASPARGSGSRSHARSSRRTAAASASTPTRARARPSGSSCRAAQRRCRRRRRHEGGGRMSKRLGWLLAGAARRRAGRRRRGRAVGGEHGPGDDQDQRPPARR